ncbi:hypothetical protein DSUL_20504 [Desulfovibrionales bacterium]
MHNLFAKSTNYNTITINNVTITHLPDHETFKNDAQIVYLP